MKLSSLFFFLITLNSGSLWAYDITLSWTASTQPGIIGYRLYRKTAPSSHFTALGVTATNQVTVRGLVEGELYYFKIAAWKKTGGAVETTQEVVYFAKQSQRKTGSTQQPATLTVATQPGVSYVVESSSDLKIWQQTAVLAATSPIIQYNTSVNAARFIRIRRQTSARAPFGNSLE